jgi:hypothetical protein
MSELKHDSIFTVEISVLMDKLNKLNVEYEKTGSMETRIDTTNKMCDLVSKVNYSLNFYEMVLKSPDEMNELLNIETDIVGINELNKRLDEDEVRLDKWSIEKQCEEYIKLQAALKNLKNEMNNKAMLIRKVN